MSKKRLLSIELNEVNFDYIKKYIELGYLPNFKELISQNKLIETFTNEKHKNLEPWINWVTARTGKDFSEHKIFHLGEYNKKSFDQHIHKLSKNHLNVSSIASMNSYDKYNSIYPYIPDPWSLEEPKGNFLLKNIFKVIKKNVQNNASGKTSIVTYLIMAVGVFYYGGINSLITQSKLFIKSLKSKWVKAVILDQLLIDIYIHINKKKYFNYSSIFLNAAAHLQHHYLYNSIVINKKLNNPSWYIHKNDDPVLFIFNSYDTFIGKLINKFKDENTRIVICTALSQTACREIKYYWKLKVIEFFETFSSPKFKYLSRMSRDFELEFESNSEAIIFNKFISKILINNISIFKTDLRGSNLFCELIYSSEITNNLEVFYENQIVIKDFRKYVDFIAIKNGEHADKGYLIDTENQFFDKVNLKEIHNQVVAHFT